MKAVQILVALCASAAFAQDHTPAALADEIKSLPGVPADAKFRMFSGYIPVSEDGSRQLFYWHVESQSKPATDPLLLWSNGGPGCSGLGGFLSEQGPFRVGANGNLTMNPHAWNKLANMVFIEQPAGVGFSTNSKLKGFAYGDEQAAADNWEFVKGFAKRFPQYRTRPFYITSESYGGHYMPTLARQIVRNNKGEVNFRGFAVGNPLTYMPDRNYGQYGTYAGHNLLPQPEFAEWDAKKCYYQDSATPVPAANKADCQRLTDRFDALTAHMDPYALDFPTCTSGAAGAALAREERWHLLKFHARTAALRTGGAGRWRHALASAVGKSANVAVEAEVQAAVTSDGSDGGYFPAEYEPCASNYGADYLNRADVQAAIHVRGRVTWGMCSDAVSNAYSQSDVNAPMMPVYRELVASGAIDIMVYSGDDDAICATAGSQRWIWDMGYNNSEPWRPIIYPAGQTAGFTTYFQDDSATSKGGGFRFTTVHGAGHMVPQTRPSQSLEILRRFLNNQW